MGICGDACEGSGFNSAKTQYNIIPSVAANPHPVIAQITITINPERVCMCQQIIKLLLKEW